jgi:hypothetical protein
MMSTRPAREAAVGLDLPSTGHKLVEALLFQDLNAQILRAIRGDLVSHARDRRRMSHVARLTEAWAVHAFELTQLKDVTVKGSDDVFAGAKGRIAGVQGGHTVSSF